MELHTVARMNSSRTTPHETVVNKLVWDIEYKETFCAATCISENIAYVNDLSCELDRSNALDSISDITKKFSEFLYNKASPLFNKTFCTKNMCNDKINNSWFNDECKSARVQFNNARNRFNRHKTDLNRTYFTQRISMYNNTKRKAMNKFKKSTIDCLFFIVLYQRHHKMETNYIVLSSIFPKLLIA